MRPGKGERAAQLLLALTKSACYLGLFLGMQVVVMLPLGIAAGVQSALGGGMDVDSVYNLLANNAMAFSLISGVLTLMVILIFYRVCGKRPSEALWLRRVPAPVLWEGAALAPGLYLVVTAMLYALPEAWTESYSEASAGLDDGGLMGILAIVVVAPVVEEFIFRGLIMTRLSRAMPGWLAIVLSAAVFGACHGHPVWFAYAFLLGAVFGLMDWRAGSIWPSILAHMIFNGIGQGITLVPETESGAAELAVLTVLLAAAVIAPLLDRKAVAALFRRRPKAAPVCEPPAAAPGEYPYNPWEE